MKRMKKILAGILSATMIMSMGLTVFAEDTNTDAANVTINKVYKEVNEGTVSPEETFTLKQVGNGVVKDGEADTAPALGTIGGAAFAKGAATVDGATGDITIALPEYSRVGVYEYTLQEVAGSTAGVTYYGNSIKLVVTVIQSENGKLRVAAVHTEEEGEAKNNSFENQYSAGTLNVTKTVTGNLGDQSKKFDFTVVFTKPEGKNVNSEITATVAGVAATDFNPVFETNGTYTYTFKLAHGETATFTNIPYGVEYVVTETADQKYTTTKTNDEGMINSASVTAAFTNNKSGNVDTGINMDSLPYILVFAGVLVIAAIAFIARKRRMEY